QDPSFRIVPPTTSKSVSVKDTLNSLGLQDTLRLDQWEETQDNLKLTALRKLQG
ncbi:hypothetical protein GGX14DRAFT_609956, partial [Mycena pura]